MRRAIAGDYAPRAHVTLLQKDTRLALKRRGRRLRWATGPATRTGRSNAPHARAPTWTTPRCAAASGRPMTTVLVVEDDDAIRNNVARLLQAGGLRGQRRRDQRHRRPGARARRCGPTSSSATSTCRAWTASRCWRRCAPSPALATTPVMLLTALDDRASMRRGMTAGADDYLAKPFTRVELLDALDGLLKQARPHRRSPSSRRCRRARSTCGAPSPRASAAASRTDRFGLEAPAGAVTDQVLQATVLFSDIRNFTSLAEKLDRRGRRTADRVLRAHQRTGAAPTAAAT
jgi:CheY-like chemotaxis protein